MTNSIIPQPFPPRPDFMPAKRPRLPRNARHADPVRDLLTAIALRAVDDIFYPSKRQKLTPDEMYSATLLIWEWKGFLTNLGIPARKVEETLLFADNWLEAQCSH